ncbi:MAG: DUF262 domain-containing protein [Tannerellaceae bacterium]|jgi:hypothetical protein|nr:DUF262 domain-containing protein [Tannerellaceae bacterium]
MISLKLNTGHIANLTPNSEDGILFHLIDDQGISQIDIKKEDNRFIWEDKKNIDEDDDTLRQKLDTLYTEIEDEFTVGIETEAEDSFTDPFDPEEISINTKLYSMDACLRRLIQETIILNPNFQRQEVWKNDRKSRLIESLMLKIPIPMFYVSADENGILTMVDGLQRFSAIRDFVLGQTYLKTKKDNDKGKGFRLQDLEFWKEYEGKNFKELPINIANRIVDSKFTFIIINPGTPEEVKRNIFKRINTGGLPLSSQEIRNALYVGQATTLLNKLASFDAFKKATDYSIKNIRMEDKELILRFVSFLIRKYTSFKKVINVDTWLSDTMIIVNALPNLDTRDLKKQVNKANATIEISSVIPISIDNIENKFTLAMTRAYKLFGKHTFRKSYDGKRRTSINKSLFETWGVLLSEISEDQFDQLCRNRENMIIDYSRLINDNNFSITISRDSMKPASVQSRFETISGLIKEFSR